MKLQRVLENLSEYSNLGFIPQGIIDEGRIFALGAFENEDKLHGRVTDVVEGLREHVGQPFELHPWAFVYEISTFKQDGMKSRIPVAGVVWPQADGAVYVSDFIVSSKRLRLIKRVIFRHTQDGTIITVSRKDAELVDAHELAGSSFYPPAIAILNTRGCNVDLKRAPSVTNARRKRQGKCRIPARYDVDASEYFTALGSSESSEPCDGTHASPLPHLRRAHERLLPNGKRIWIPSALINVRSEGDIAFVERRKAYRNDDS